MALNTVYIFGFMSILSNRAARFVQMKMKTLSEYFVTARCIFDVCFFSYRRKRRKEAEEEKKLEMRERCGSL